MTYGDPTFSVAPETGDTEAAVKYVSSNEDVASVDENGVVTIKNAGEVTITPKPIDTAEVTLIANGASEDVVLTVKDGSATISDASKAQMGKGADGYTIGQYLDITLFKYMTVDGVTQDGVQLHKNVDEITISVQILESLINTDKNVKRTYCIIRNHDGEVTILDAVYDASAKTLTFQINLFSDYAIGYQDTKVKDNEDPKKDDPEDPKQEDPKKDDNNGGMTGNNGRC